VFYPLSGRAALLGALILTGAAAWSGAQAARDCTGTVQASLLHPLPKPLVVGSQRNLDDATNPQLARRFTDGLQQAGITLGDRGANTTLSVAVSIATPPPDSNIAKGTYKGFNWVSGDQLPPGTRVPGILSATLSISAVLADTTAATQSWVATIDCKVQTDDPGALAQYIGSTIGRVMGQNTDRKVI
jgi:hypothetical protein